jgi:outer membrane protein assembly factor BamD
LQLAPPAGGTGVGAEVLSAPSGSAPITGGAPNDGSAGMKAVGPTNTALPAAEKAAEAPVQINEVKSNGPTVTNTTDKKKPKVNDKEESDSKKKKKKGLAKLNPF